MVSNFAREAEDLAIPAREFASLQSAVARQAGQRSPHFELFCPPFWIFVKDFQKVEFILLAENDDYLDIS